MIDVSMKSLKEKLQADGSLLARVAQVWYVDPAAVSAPSTLPRLVERMRDPCAARSVWERLPLPERACLFQAVEASARRKGIPAERAMKKARLSPDEGPLVIARLVEQWGLIEEGEVLPNPTAANPHPVAVRTLFAFRESGETLERTGQELFKSYADRSTLSLDRLLGQFAWSDLEKLAGLCHVPTSPTRSPYSGSSWPSISHPADLRTRVAEALTRSPVALELLRQIDPEAQRLFVWLCIEQQGKARLDAVRAFLGQAEEQVLTVLHQLETHALAFDTFTHAAERWLCIPQGLFDVVEHEVREQTADEQTFALFPVTTPPPSIREGQPGICYDLATVIGYVHQHDLEPTKDGQLPRRVSSKLRPLLHGRPRIRDIEGEPYVDQVFQMAQGMGLLRCATPYGEEKARYQPGPNLPAWEKRNLVDQARLVLAEWRKSTTWYDINADGKLIYPSAYNTGAVRKALLHHLRSCLPGHWYRLDALLYVIWKEQPIPFSAATSRHDRQPSQPTSLRTHREQWMQRGDGQLYAGMLAAALHEMGLVSLGYPCEPGAIGAAPQPAEWFQLTPLGAVAMADGPVGEEEVTSGFWFTPEERPLVVQPSFELLLLQPAMPVLYELIHWSEIKRVGPVSTLTLTQKALLRGMAAGYSVQQILTLLAQQGRKDLAQNVAYTINDWSRAYKGACLAEVILVDTSSEQVALDLLRLLAESCIEARTLTPCTLAIFPAGTSLPVLRRLLEKAGVFVRVDAHTAARHPSYR
jgi:hypothetical protein